MSLVRWNPTSHLVDFRSEMDKLFDNFFGTDVNTETGLSFAPAVDIEENEKEYLVHAELPGMNKKDITVNIKDNMLTISGEKKSVKEEKGKDYHRKERSFGKFERSFRLPELVDREKVKADYNNGVISIMIPKKEEAISKNIDIKIN